MTDIEKVAWGIKLCGHDFDLQDWRETLKEPFDLAVVQQGDDFILRASEFQSCDSAPAVLDKAIVLIEVLNGAMRCSHPVKPCGVYELLPEGWRKSSHVFPLRPLQT